MLISVSLFLVAENFSVGQPSGMEIDVVVYGATSAGIVAALQALRMGKTVRLIEPSRHLGGLTTGGLGQTDIGNKAAIGGLSRAFYRAIADYYQRTDSWKWQQRTAYKGTGQSITEAGEETQWTFEPSAAAAVFSNWMAQHKLSVDTGLSIKQDGVLLKDGRILSVALSDGSMQTGKMFIDASYEGDLTAAAGVNYTIGREAESVYQESLAGVQTRYAIFHQFEPGVSAYRIADDPSSGLLPGILPNGPGRENSGDRWIQAYCFRLCLTDHPDNRIPFECPEGYVEADFELLFRNFERGACYLPWINSPMPNRKTDTNNYGAVSMDFIGGNSTYPTANAAERRSIIKAHEHYQRALMWTLANHARIPEQVRREVSRWGLAKDEFAATGGWPPQLYIREARRMLGERVMTQHHCQGNERVQDPIALGSYGIDSHHVQRWVNASGHVRNEGDVEVAGFAPFGISYRSILPARSECINLLVPVCLSASHIAFGSVRMEPVFMALGQSAATAAVLAVEQNIPLHDLPYSVLRDKLISDGQILSAPEGSHK